MKTLNELIIEKFTTNESITESYSKSVGHKNVERSLSTLESALKPGSNLCKQACAALGDGAEKDFLAMQKLVEQLSVMWDEMNYELSHS